MNQKIILQAESVLKMLNIEDINKKVVTVNLMINKELFDYLENIGNTFVKYDFNQAGKFLNESDAKLDLWNKNIKNEWIVNIYNIETLINQNYHQQRITKMAKF